MSKKKTVKKKRKPVLFVEDIPVKLREAFRLKCMNSGTTIKAKVLHWIEAYVA